MPLELSAEVTARIRAIVARYPRAQAALLPVLHLVQHELGYLSADAQYAVATVLDVPPTLVHEVTTFYEMFHEHREGQYHLELCTNISCHLAGADALIDHVKEMLGVEVGHQTEDGVFSLVEAECLASCGSGPMMKCGMDYYEHLTIPAIDALLGRFKKEAPSLGGRGYVHGPDGPHTGAVPGFAPTNSARAEARTTQPPVANGDGAVHGNGEPRASLPAFAAPAARKSSTPGEDT